MTGTTQTPAPEPKLATDADRARMAMQPRFAEHVGIDGFVSLSARKGEDDGTTPAAEGKEAGKRTPKAAPKAEKARGEAAEKPTADAAPLGDEDPDDDAVPADLPVGVRRRLARERARNVQLQGQIEQLQAQLDELRGAGSAEAAEKPDAHDFETVEDYEKALGAWRAKATKAPAEKSPEQKIKEADNTKQDVPPVELRIAVRALQSYLAETDPDLWLSIRDASDFLITPEATIAISKMPDPARLLRYFHDNKNQLLRFQGYHGERLHLELGRLDGRLVERERAAEAERGGRKISQAPRPITPVKASGGGTVAGGDARMNLDTMSFSEFEALRAEQEAARNRGGWR